MNRTTKPSIKNDPFAEYVEKTSSAIHNSLNILTKIHSPTEQFLEVFDKDMFVKPNTKAFIQVMHFLFTILDPKEFKTRFYWPIYDKASENSFRTSTIEYVNFLVEKHKLKMPKWIAYNVVQPGGLKFMVLLLQLINLITREVIQRKSGGKEAVNPATRFTRADLNNALAQHKFWCETGVKFKEAIHADIAMLSAKTAAIDNLLALHFKETDILARGKLTEFLNEWCNLNQQRLVQLKHQHQTVKAIDAKFEQLLETTTNKMLQWKMNITVDENKFAASLEALRQFHPEQKSCFENVLTNQRFNITKLVNILNVSLAEFERYLEQFSIPNSSAIDYELTEVAKLAGSAEKVRRELQSLDGKLQLLQSFVTINDSDEEAMASRSDVTEMDEMRTRLIATPPVSFNFALHAGVGRPTRLALLDEEVQQLNQPKVILKPSKLGLCRTEPQSPTNTSLNTSPIRRKVNPLGLLNTLSRSARKTYPDPANQYSQQGIQASAKLFQLRPEKSSMLSSTMLTLSPDVESPTASGRTVTNNYKFTGFGSPISSIGSPSPIISDSSPPKRRSKTQIIIPEVTFASNPFNQQFKKNIFSEQVYETTTTTNSMSPDSKMLFSSITTMTKRNSVIHLQGPLTPKSVGQHENYFQMLHTSPTGHLEPLLVMNYVPHSNVPRIVLNADSFNSDTTDESRMDKTASSTENSVIQGTPLSTHQKASYRQPVVLPSPPVQDEPQLQETDPSVSNIISDLESLKMNDEMLFNVSDTILENQSMEEVSE